MTLRSQNPHSQSPQRSRKNRTLFPGTLALALVSSAALLRAQSPPPADKVPAFDIISVKPNNSGLTGVDIDFDDGNFSASNVSLKLMLSHAFLLKEGQVLGLPPWAGSARFDIQAKIVDPDKAALDRLTNEQRASMLQPILTGRFGLKSHTETRVLPTFDLVVVKGGPKFRESTLPNSREDMTTHHREMTATAVTLNSLAAHLSSQLQRIVIDKTLAGHYDFTLKWSPDDAPPNAVDNAPPTLFTALQEQLGLKLVPSHTSVPVVVVDSVELPSAN